MFFQKHLEFNLFAVNQRNQLLAKQKNNYKDWVTSHKSTEMVENFTLFAGFACWALSLHSASLLAQPPFSCSREESSVLAHSCDGLGWGQPPSQQLCFPGVAVPGLAVAKAVACAGVPLPWRVLVLPLWWGTHPGAGWGAWAPSAGG